MSGLFGETKKALNSGSASGSKDTGAITGRLSELVGILDSDSMMNGFGAFEDWLQGSEDRTERNNLQSLFRAVTSGDETAQRGRDLRKQIDPIFFEEVAEALEGQGQVSNFERIAGRNSITTLGTDGISDSSNKQEAQRLLDAFQFGDHRSKSGVTIDENGFETQNGKNVVTYRGKDGRIYSQEVDEPTVYIPEWATDDMINSVIGQIPVGSKFVYKNEIYTREDNAEARQLTEN